MYKENAGQIKHEFKHRHIFNIDNVGTRQNVYMKKNLIFGSKRFLTNDHEESRLRLSSYIDNEKSR